MVNITSAAVSRVRLLAAELQHQPHFWHAAFFTVKFHLISAYFFTIFGKPLEPGFTFLDKLAEARGWAYWAHRISFAVIACILLHDFTLLVLLPLCQRLSHVISRLIIHIALTFRRAESSWQELPETASNDANRKSSQKLSFGQIDDITQMSRLKDREDMALIRDHRILPSGSKWTKEFWTVEDDREWQLGVALRRGHIVHFGRQLAVAKREGLREEL